MAGGERSGPGRDPTRRFSDRVESYSRSRPAYPEGVLDVIARETGLPEPFVVADVGSGTGIFTRLLLGRGHTAWAVEPNEPMRLAAEAALSAKPGFRSVDGRAEATSLPDASVDLVTAAQAFHWFDPGPTRAEWRRILRPPRWTALLWNDRLKTHGPFDAAYEALLVEWGGAEYLEVRGSWDVDVRLATFFGDGWTRRTLPNAQSLDLPGLEGRLRSSSYLPGPGDPRHVELLAAARSLFMAHQVDGIVELAYETRVYVGRV